MYKGTSKSIQRLVSSGRSATNQKKRLGGGRKKNRLHIKLDESAKRQQMMQWATYVNDCRSIGKEPEIPDEVLGELKRLDLV